MKHFLDLNSQLTFYRFDICIRAMKNTTFDGWIGGILRNSLLFAMHQFHLPGQSCTLFEYCKQNPLPTNHPLYSELKTKVPRPFHLHIYPADKFHKETVVLNKGENLCFSLSLIGHVVQYLPLFVEAIRFMCNKGIGDFNNAFQLIDVYEAGSFQLSTDMHVPKQSNIKITFESPTNLIKPKRTKEAFGYQEKANAFPSFYQLVRSAANRLEKLHALYAYPYNLENYLESHACIDAYIEPAGQALLEEACIRKIHMQGPKKTVTNFRIPLVGFIGTQTYQGDFRAYYPLLKYMEWLGVGHELTYGFGKYKIEID